MCRIFARQDPARYALETRSLRLNGQGTSIRLEMVFWDILERIAAGQNLTLPRFLSTLHTEILEIRGEAPNFTSHLRCICIVFLECDSAPADRQRDSAPAGSRRDGATAERQRDRAARDKPHGRAPADGGRRAARDGGGAAAGARVASR